MEITKLGISREFLPTPGDTIAEMLDERHLSQKDLATRINKSESYISKVISGEKGISGNLAKGLEYVLGVDASFWLNLQANYEALLLNLNEEDSITEEESTVLKKLEKTGLIEYLKEFDWLQSIGHRIEDAVLAVRRVFGVGSLCSLRKVAEERGGAFRVGNAKIDDSVMGAWLLIAERISEVEVSHEFTQESIPELIVALKNELNSESEGLQKRLTSVLESFGISFAVIKHFRGAPVQGYIAKGRGETETYRIVMTIRGAWADQFWFTLFHELGHIANGDLSRTNDFVDGDADVMQNETERAADQFARRALLDDGAYAQFIRENESSGFLDSRIRQFAQSQGVPAWIVKGRLQKDRYLDYGNRTGMVKYGWASKNEKAE